jgi:hypothetical protein
MPGENEHLSRDYVSAGQAGRPHARVHPCGRPGGNYIA